MISTPDNDENVVNFPPADKAPEFMVGPFEEIKVVLEGYFIPNLSAFKEGDKTFIVVDHRFCVGVPHEMAYDICWLIANAMATCQGYANFTSEDKFKPFATKARQMDAS